MKLVNTKDAIGHVLCHDITQIIKGKTKDVVFSKGHIVTAEDIPVLLSVGKDHLYIWEDKTGYLHENDAAEILCNVSKGNNIKSSQVKEGKIDLFATTDGLLKINRKKLKEINAVGELMIASRHGDFFIEKDEKIAGTRVIPLVIAEEKLNKAKEIAGEDPIFQILELKSKKIGIIATGNEIFHGRINDTFTPVIVEKLKEYKIEIVQKVVLSDDPEQITCKCLQMIDEGMDFIICTGGMSVDPDDLTPLAIKNTGAHMISYGAPVLPGAMFLLAYFNDKIPIIGLPGCVMYAKRTIFDLILPRILADDMVTAEELFELGEGGLCLNCSECHFPNCGFGKRT